MKTFLKWFFRILVLAAMLVLADRLIYSIMKVPLWTDDLAASILVIALFHAWCKWLDKN